MKGRPLSPPIPTAAVHAFDSYEGLAEYHQRRFDGQRYGRDSSDIVLELEEQLSRPNYKALLFGSGMSAITAVLETLVEDRTLYVPNEYYRKLRDLTRARWKIIEYGDVREIEPTGPSLIWLESPSNPHLKVADYLWLEGLRKLPHDLRIVADFTMAGLDNWLGPFWLLDAIVHSCTKYAGGHNDTMAGLALVKPQHYAGLWDRRSFAGGILDPWTAWLLARSLKTYDLRMTRHLENTAALLTWLHELLPAEHIFYPRDYDAYHRHGGAVVSFLAGCDNPVELTERAARLRTAKMGPNFGAVDTLIEVPATMSHYGKSREELARAGIEPDLVRLSVGIEPVADIGRDLVSLLCVAG